MCGFLISLNLQEIFYNNLRETWRSPHVFKLEAISNAISSHIFESELFQSSHNLLMSGPELGWAHLGFPFLE